MALKQFTSDCSKWVQRSLQTLWKGLKGDLIMQPETQILYDFRTPETLNNFLCVTDKSVGGKSVAKLTTSKHGRLLFTGSVSQDIEDYAEIDYSGFCAFRSKPLIGLFNKVETTDMSPYDCVEIKYRGDGRPYFVNIQSESMMFMDNHDLYQAFLFTKGGPYWEVERIPFTRFIMTYKGYLQDEQFDFKNIRTVGVSLSDKKSGPFNLEIEYLKLVRIGFQPIVFKHQHYRKRFQKRD